MYCCSSGVQTRFDDGRVCPDGVPIMGKVGISYGIANMMRVRLERNSICRGQTGGRGHDCGWPRTRRTPSWLLGTRILLAPECHQPKERQRSRPYGARIVRRGTCITILQRSQFQCRSRPASADTTFVRGQTVAPRSAASRAFQGDKAAKSSIQQSLYHMAFAELVIQRAPPSGRLVRSTCCVRRQIWRPPKGVVQ